MCCFIKKRHKTYGPHQLHLTKEVAGLFTGTILNQVDDVF